MISLTNCYQGRRIIITKAISNIINFTKEREKRMLDLALQQPLQEGINVIKITANDMSFATTALVDVEIMNTEEIFCKNIQLVSTVGFIQNWNFVNNAIVTYVNQQKIS